MKRYLFLMAAISSCLLFLVGCSEKDEDLSGVIFSFEMNVSSVALEAGETVQLTVVTDPSDADVTLTWTSSNEEVAIVSNHGLVTAISEGSSKITAQYLDYSAECEVSVTDVQEEPEPDPEPDEPESPESLPAWDFREALSAPLSESVIYSKNVLQKNSGRIMQCFDLASDGSIYYAQLGTNAVPVNVCRAPGPNENADSEYMILNYFGHGTQMAVEEADDGKTYVWVGSNGAYSNGEFADGVSISRIEFTPGATYDHCGGETFFLNKNGETNQYPSFDFVSRRMLVTSHMSGHHYYIFDYDDVMALPLKNMRAYVSDGTESTMLTVEARDLNDCKMLGHFTIQSGSNYDTDVLSYSGQGAEIWGDYIYVFEGEALAQSDGTYQPKAYVTCFDYSGNIVIPRTEVAAVADVEALNTYGLTTIGYAEGEGIKIRDGKLYLGFGCRESSGNRYADILVFDGVPFE